MTVVFPSRLIESYYTNNHHRILYKTLDWIVQSAIALLVPNFFPLFFLWCVLLFFVFFTALMASM